jgi:hypothetical protein
MNRIDIEIKLNRDRAWLLETLSTFTDEELRRGVTGSEHDPEVDWSFADHFVHTTLIERDWNAMIRRHISGEQGMKLGVKEDGTREPTENVMGRVHAWTERWAEKHRGKPLDELARVGLEVRADTLQLLSELTDDQLASVIPNAPWADGTVGGILAANADHGRRHFKWAKEGAAARGLA